MKKVITLIKGKGGFNLDEIASEIVTEKAKEFYSQRKISDLYVEFYYQKKVLGHSLQYKEEERTVKIPSKEIYKGVIDITDGLVNCVSGLLLFTGRGMSQKGIYRSVQDEAKKFAKKIVPDPIIINHIVFGLDDDIKSFSLPELKKRYTPRYRWLHLYSKPKVMYDFFKKNNKNKKARKKIGDVIVKESTALCNYIFFKSR